MAISIERTDRTDRDDWNRAVERAPYTNPFHQYEALEVLADHSDTELHPLVGYNGAEPIGVFPLFASDRGRWTTALSPPWLLKSFYLGPALLNLGKMKRRKAERYRRSFVEGCLDWVDDHLDAARLKFRADPRFDDVRPFNWNGFDATPYYTYVVDLTGDPETIMDRFSRDARSNVRNTDESRYSVREGDQDAVRRIIALVADRHAIQDEPYRLTPEFVVDLYDRLPDGQIRPYVCRVDGELATGLVVLEYGDTMYRWQGGVTPDVDVPATDLLDWHLVRAAHERGRTRYDLIGANIPRLCEYKAKFGPEVEAYYNLEKRSPLVRLSSRTRSVTNAVGRRMAGALTGSLF